MIRNPITYPLSLITSRAKRGFISEFMRRHSYQAKRDGIISDLARKDNHRAKRDGYTIIELLVVIGIISIVGAITSDVFLNVTRSYNKANIIAQIEQNGNLALSQMSVEIRNSRSVSPTSGATPTLTLVDVDGKGVVFSFVPQTQDTNGYADRNGIPLTDNSFSTGVNVTQLSFVVTSANPTVVYVELSLAQPLGAPGRVDYQAQTTLRTSVSLRTY